MTSAAGVSVRIDTATVRRLEDVVDASGLGPWFETELRTVTGRLGGRRRILTARALLVELLALSVAEQPLILRDVVRLLNASTLGQAPARHPRPGITGEGAVTERQVSHLFNRLTALLDPRKHRYVPPPVRRKPRRRTRLLADTCAAIADAQAQAAAIASHDPAPPPQEQPPHRGSRNSTAPTPPPAGRQRRAGHSRARGSARSGEQGHHHAARDSPDPERPPWTPKRPASTLLAGRSRSTRGSIVSPKASNR